MYSIFHRKYLSLLLLITNIIFIVIPINGESMSYIQRNVTADFLLSSMGCQKFGMFTLDDDKEDCRCPPSVPTFMKPSDESRYGCVTYPTRVEDCTPITMDGQKVVPLLQSAIKRQVFETSNIPCAEGDGMQLYVLAVNHTYVRGINDTSSYFLRAETKRGETFTYTLVKTQNTIVEHYPGLVVKIYFSACGVTYCLYFKVEGEAQWITESDPTVSSSILASQSSVFQSSSVFQNSQSKSLVSASIQSKTTEGSVSQHERSSTSNPVITSSNYLISSIHSVSSSMKSESQSEPKNVLTSVQVTSSQNSPHLVTTLSLSSSVLPPTTPSSSSDESSTDKVIIGTGSALAMLFICLAVLVIYLLCRRRNRNKKRNHGNAKKMPRRVDNGDIFMNNNSAPRYQTANSIQSLSDVVITGIDDIDNPVYTSQGDVEDNTEDADNPYENAKELKEQRKKKQDRSTTNFYLQAEIQQ